MDLIAQRVFGLALGYEDLNDHDELRRDPMLAVALGKDDVKGEHRRRAQDRGKALAGKSTLNRLELTAPDYEVARGRGIRTSRRPRRSWWTRRASMRCWWICFWRRHSKLPKRSYWIWMPPTIACIGHQEGRFYHGYYHDYCYLPLYVFCGEHLLCARLRMSNIDASADSVEELEPLIARIRQCWPAVQDSVAGRWGFLPGETDGVVRTRGFWLCPWTGAE